MSTTRNTRRLARQTLARLKPHAMMEADRLEAAGETREAEYTTALGAAVMQHATIDRLDGLHIYQAETGKFHADFHFRDMPRYMPDVIGTSKEMPLDSEQEAEAWAIEAMAGIFLAGRRAGKPGVAEPDQILFAIYDQTLFIPIAVVDLVRETAALSPSDACFVVEREYRAMGSLITKENLAKLAPTDAMTFIVAIASLLIAGTPRYPLRWPLPG